MKPTHVVRIFAFVASFFWLSAQADMILPAPNWSLQDARGAAAQVDALAAVKPLFELARSGRNEALLKSLKEVSARASWPMPARERVLYSFALGLSDLAPDAAGPEVMGWLLAYQPRTLVPHEDHPMAGVPLFRVSAAAAGTLHAWQRQTAADESTRLLQQAEDAWLEAYLASAPAGRRGFIDSLDRAGTEQLGRLAERALERLPAEPEFTLTAARVGALLSDPAILRRTVATGGGPDLAPALRSTAKALDEVGRADVLRHAIAKAPPVNAALAIAELAPGLLHQPEVTELLFVKLGDPEIGSAAALALSASKNPSVRERLTQMARGGTGLDARRAAMALETSRNGDGEARQ